MHSLRIRLLSLAAGLSLVGGSSLLLPMTATPTEANPCSNNNFVYQSMKFLGANTATASPGATQSVTQAGTQSATTTQTVNVDSGNNSPTCFIGTGAGTSVGTGGAVAIDE